MKMQDLDKIKTWEDAVRFCNNDREEAMHCFKTGVVGKWHRKQKTERDRAILEAVKDDPKFKDIVKQHATKRTA